MPWGIVRYTWPDVASWVYSWLVFEQEEILHKMVLPRQNVVDDYEGFENWIRYLTFGNVVPSVGIKYKNLELNQLVDAWTDQMLNRLNEFYSLPQLFIAV